MAKFPKTLTGAEVSDIDLSREDFQFHGQQLTEQCAEQMAEKVFHRPDNLIPGGKSLSGNNEHSPVVQARVPAAVHAKLQVIADRRQVSLSKLLREAIDQFVADQEHRPFPGHHS
ncbi:ribbon-helix-helix protein, CopG family [Mycobacterium sp.]|uniref:ribbon-helix-helix protein, CopG family n=1 Tax=Mycobacterium sp. TaxID=1785 RepID=UPI003D0B79A2